jgi:vesicle transport protein SEC22
VQIRFTIISRQSDGLPLVATMESQQEEDLISTPKRIAKSLLRSLAHTNSSPSYKYDPASLPHQGSISADEYTFHYTVEQDVVFLVLCDRTYPRVNALRLMICS